MRIKQITEGRHDKYNNKVIFMAGGSGSGKTYFAKKISNITGMKRVDIDKIYEFLAYKQKVNLKNPNFSIQKRLLYAKSLILYFKNLKMYIDSGLGIILEGTSRNYIRRKLVLQYLKSKGYDCAMVFIDTNKEKALQQNRERSRVVDDRFIISSNDEVRQYIEQYKTLFGNNFFQINNQKNNTEMELKAILNWLNT